MENGQQNVHPGQPDEDALHSIDLQARLIRDPIRRLEYLLRITSQGLPAQPLASRRRRPGLRTATLAAVVLLLPAGYHSEDSAPLYSPAATAGKYRAEQLAAVWLVEKAGESDTYSNGLRIENLFMVDAPPGSYIAFVRSASGLGPAETCTEPAGIVFHTTESHLVAFEEKHAEALEKTGLGLLDYVRRNRSYHFVVDRFGRVYRIVPETSAANHAGWSVWADQRRIYVNLNRSFLGVAFEGQSRPVEGRSSVNDAQIHAGRALAQMLRSKYRIPACNCVTHAQVSVNPQNLRFGYHTDWAEDFPFREMGLPSNYEEPLPSVSLFGFEPGGPAPVTGTGRGLAAAEELVRLAAIRRGMPEARYRAVLRLKWRQVYAELENTAQQQEKRYEE